MSAPAALRAALRDVVGPAARAHGYRGGVPHWRKTNELGDVAAVYVQSSMFNGGATARCVVEIGLVPAPLQDWQHELGRAPAVWTSVYGLVRERRYPTDAPPGVDHWWQLRDEQDAVPVARDVAASLEADGFGYLDRLLDRTALLEHVRGSRRPDGRDDLWGVTAAEAEALLVCDSGPDVELEALLDECLARSSDRERTERFVAWVRARAQAAR